jgi:hypothetical protein
MQLDAITKIHSLPMGGKEFNTWFQEWSQYECHSQVDEATKMYAFRKNLNPLLHQKIIQITPQPTTLVALVDKARDLDQNWRLYGGPHDSFKGTPRPLLQPECSDPRNRFGRTSKYGNKCHPKQREISKMRLSYFCSAGI